MERYLTVKEAAELYAVTPQTVYTWVENGLVDSIRVGRTVRIKAPETQKPPAVDKRAALVDLFAGFESVDDAADMMDKLEAVLSMLERERQEREQLTHQVQALERALQDR